jgi:hypothetical protein
MTENKKHLKSVTSEEVDLDLKKRDARVFELRIQGNTFDQIASEVGFSGPSGAWQAYQRVKESHIFESVDEARQLELMRLDEMQFAIWDRAINGELPALQCVLKIMDRRAKLLGLDKPEKIELNQMEHWPADLDKQVQELQEMIEFGMKYASEHGIETEFTKRHESKNKTRWNSGGEG